MYSITTNLGIRHNTLYQLYISLNGAATTFESAFSEQLGATILLWYDFYAI